MPWCIDLSIKLSSENHYVVSSSGCGLLVVQYSSVGCTDRNGVQENVVRQRAAGEGVQNGQLLLQNKFRC